MAPSGPVDRLSCDRLRDPPSIELTPGLGEAVAAFDQTQRQAACLRTSRTGSDRLLVEVPVLSLEGERQALDLAAVEGSEKKAYPERIGENPQHEGDRRAENLEPDGDSARGLDMMLPVSAVMAGEA